MASINKMISSLLEVKFEEEEFKDLFLVDISYTVENNKVEVFLESDERLSYDKLRRINRFIQSYLDENGTLGEKYILDVSSPGVGKPLKLFRQYKKNVNRKLEVWLTEGKPVTGILQQVDEEKILIIQEKGKGKKKETIQHEISFDQIKRSVVKISF